MEVWKMIFLSKWVMAVGSMLTFQGVLNGKMCLKSWGEYFDAFETKKHLNSQAIYTRDCLQKLWQYDLIKVSILLMAEIKNPAPPGMYNTL